MVSDALTALFSWLSGLDTPGSITRVLEWHWYAAVPLPVWVMGGVALFGLAIAAINFLPHNAMPWQSRIAVSVIRLTGFAVLIVLLCQFEMRLLVERSLQPNVAIVTDTSGSMAIRDVTGKSRLDAARAFQTDLASRLNGKTSLASYTVDWRLQPGTGSGEASGLSNLLDGLGELSRQERDAQAVILLTDGNDTTGNSGAAVAPIYAARGLPVYPVVFGSPTAPPMTSVKITGAGDYVRLGDELHLQADITSTEPQEQIVRAKLFVAGRDKPLASQESIRLGKTPQTIYFTTKPEKPGRYVYKIVVDGIRQISSARLLEAEHTVDVIDQRIRTLIIDIPRDERKLLYHWLKADPVVDVASLLMLPANSWYGQGILHHDNIQAGLPERESELYEYDVIILGDIPRSYFLTNDPYETRLLRLVDFVKRRGGGLITLGGTSVYSAGQYEGSALAAILPFGVERTKDGQIPKRFNVLPTALGLGHPILQLDRDPETNRNAWLDLPQLEGCNRVGRMKPGALLLAARNLNGESLPVLAYHEVGKGRVLALTVDTTWRWMMMRDPGDKEAGAPEATDYYRPFWGNVVRHLAPDPRLNPERPQIDRKVSDAAVGQTLTLTTRLVDRLFKPISKADLAIRVTSPSGTMVRMYPCDSVSNPGVYEYDVTLTEAGTWRVEAIRNETALKEATAKAERELAEATAAKDDIRAKSARTALAAAKEQIAVEEIVAGESRAELEDARARPDLMAGFAAATGGAALRPDQIGDLVSKLDLASHNVQRSYAIPVWNLPAVMVLFIVLVSLDCLIRKRRGMV